MDVQDRHARASGAMRERAGVATRAFRRLLALPDPLVDRLVGEPPVVRDGRVLDRRVQMLLSLGERLGVVDVEDPDDIDERRSRLARGAKLAMPLRTDVHVSERRIPGPAGQIPVRIYRRYGPSQDLPGIVYLHGGGWATGDLDSHDGTCRLLACESDCVVMSVDYRLAPEHPFPAAVDDAVAAYRWFHLNAQDLQVRPGDIGVMGDSAGGNLAAVIAQVTRDTDVPPPTAQCLVYPATDVRMREPSHRIFADGFMLTHENMLWYRSKYLPDEADWDSPLASPIEQTDLSGVAPALVVTAGFDPLRDEGRRYADMLRDAGVRTTYRCYDDMIHGFFGMGILPGGMAIASEICATMGDLMHGDE